MTAAVLDRPATQPSLLDGGGTLEELLNSALHEARTNGSTECSVCHGVMSITREGAAECGGCGSRLG